MMNSEQVAYQIDMQVGVRLEVKSVICRALENQVSNLQTLGSSRAAHVGRKWGQIWPWGQIWRVEDVIKEQARDTWEMLDGEGRE